MHRGREGDARAEDPEARPLEVEVAPSGGRDHQADHDRHRQSGSYGIRCHRLDEGEGARVEAPVPRIGTEARQQVAACAQERRHGHESHDREGDKCARPHAPDEGRKGGQGGDLGQGRCGQGDTRPSGAVRARGPEREHEDANAEDVEMSTPGGLDHQQRGQQVDGRHTHRIAA